MDIEKYLVQELTRLDCELAGTLDGTSRSYFTGLHVAYSNVLGQINPQRAVERVGDMLAKSKMRIDV